MPRAAATPPVLPGTCGVERTLQGRTLVVVVSGEIDIASARALRSGMRVITTLEDTFTPAERNMAAAGEHQRLRDIRTYFQHAAEDEFVQTTERVTGRKVRAFISGVDTHKDVAAEMFVLAPER